MSDTHCASCLKDSDVMNLLQSAATEYRRSIDTCSDNHVDTRVTKTPPTGGVFDVSTDATESLVTGPRRKKYISLRPEDMGVRVLEESLEADTSFKQSDNGSCDVRHEYDTLGEYTEAIDDVILSPSVHVINDSSVSSPLPLTDCQRDQDVEAEIVSAKLLNEFRDAIQTALDSLSVQSYCSMVEANKDMQNLDCSLFDKFATYKVAKLDNFNDLGSELVSDKFGIELDQGNSCHDNVNIDTALCSGLRRRTSSNSSLRSEDGIADSSKKQLSGDILSRLPMNSSKLGIYRHRSSLPNAICLDTRRQLLHNARKKGAFVIKFS